MVHKIELPITYFLSENTLEYINLIYEVLSHANSDYSATLYHCIIVINQYSFMFII